MIVMIDNYDSFTWNLVQMIEGVVGDPVEVVRNDAFDPAALLASRPRAIIVSPGPGTPSRAGRIVELIRADEDIPLFGVCLGHQAIAEAFGGKVVRADAPVHGKVWDVVHESRGLFAGCPSPMRATRYHSLVVERQSLPGALIVDAETAEGHIMGLAHRERPIHGVQFHPESYGTIGGEAVVRNFFAMCEARR
jgi:anthranilate synthase component 2